MNRVHCRVENSLYRHRGKEILWNQYTDSMGGKICTQNEDQKNDTKAIISHCCMSDKAHTKHENLCIWNAGYHKHSKCLTLP